MFLYELIKTKLPAFNVLEDFLVIFERLKILMTARDSNEGYISKRVIIARDDKGFSVSDFYAGLIYFRPLREQTVHGNCYTLQVCYTCARQNI